jgi:VanZ family protein
VAAVAILVLALAPRSAAPSATGWDKADHALAFVVLGTLAWWASRRPRPGVILVALTGFGIAIELVQGLPGVGRSREVADVLVEIAALGVALVANRAIARALASGGEARGTGETGH